MPIITKKVQFFIIAFSLIFLFGVGMLAFYGYPIYDFTHKSAYYTSFSINSYSNDTLGTIHLENGSYSTFISDSFMKGSTWSFIILFSDIEDKNSTFYIKGNNTNGMLLFGSGGGSGSINTNIRYNGLLNVAHDSIFKTQIINKTINNDYSILVGLKKGDYYNAILLGGIGFFIVYPSIILIFYGPVFVIFFVSLKKRISNNHVKKQYQNVKIDNLNINKKNEEKFCSFCGNSIDKKCDLYCSECGKKLKR